MAANEEIKVKVEIPKEEIIRIVKKTVNDYSNELQEEVRSVVSAYVEAMRKNIEIADNIRTQMGYEIALEILHDILKDRGYEVEDIFEEEGYDDEIF